MGKLMVENLKNRGGRPKGSVNKTTATAKSMIEDAAELLGGTARMVAWAQEAPENERVFWGSMYTKLLPLQVNGPGPDGAHLVELKTAADILGPRLDAITSRATGEPE